MKDTFEVLSNGPKFDNLSVHFNCFIGDLIIRGKMVEDRAKLYNELDKKRENF